MHGGFMKSLSVIVVFFFTICAFADDTRPILISCLGVSEVESDLTVRIAARWIPSKSLTKILVVISNEEPSAIARGELKEFNPKNPQFKGMDRFEIGSNGWSTTSILLPQKITRKIISGFYYDQGHSGLGVIPFNCKIK